MQRYCSSPDFQSLMESMLASLVATRNDTQKRNRFTSAALGAGSSAGDQERLIAELEKQIASPRRLTTSLIRYR